MIRADAMGDDRLVALQANAIGAIGAVGATGDISAEFDRMLQLAALVCQTPLAALSFIGQQRRWAQTSVALPLHGILDSMALGVDALLNVSTVILPDLGAESRFAAHPWLVAAPHVQFYAAAPLMTAEGAVIGLLEVMDQVPRILSVAQIEGLETLASQISTQCAARTSYAQLAPQSAITGQMSHVLPYSFDELAGMKAALGEHASMVVTDEHGVITDVNERFCYTAQYTRAELLGQNLRLLNSGYHSAAFIRELWQTIGGGRIWRGEIKNRAKNGDMYWVDATIVPFSNPGERPHKYVSIRTQITAHKKSEREVQRLERHLRTTLASISDAFLTLDRQWRFTYLNAESERVLRRSSSDLLGKVIWDEWPDVVGTIFEQQARLAIAQNRSVEFEAVFERFNRWFRVRIYPSDESLTIYYQDITEQKKVEIQAQTSAERFRAVARVTADAVWDWDLVGGRVWWNEGVKTLFDLDWCDGEVDSALCIEAIHPDDRAATMSVVYAAIDGDALEWSAEHRFLRQDGRYADVISRAVLIRDAAGGAVRMVGGMVDNTERKRILAAMMSVAATVSLTGGIDFFQQLTHTMSDALDAQAAFVMRLVPGDVLKARTVAATVQGSAIGTVVYDLAGTASRHLLQRDAFEVNDHYDLLYPDSPLLPLLPLLPVRAYAGRLLRNSAGTALGLLFVVFNKAMVQTDFMVSTLKIFALRAAAELERRDTDARIREQASLLDKAQDAIIVRGIDHRIQFWNKSAERLYGWDADEVLGLSIEPLLYPHSVAFLEANRQVMSCGEWNGEIVQQRKHGSALVAEGRWTLVRNEHGQAESVLCINTDITQRKAAEHRIQRLAFYDTLTQLPNRLLLLERLQQAITAPAQRIGALLFIDLDNFKTLNDTLGHDKGDLLLQQVAARLATCVRENDTVARLGGDEFVLILENLGADAVEASAGAERYGQQIINSFNLPFWLGNYEYFSTPSIGVTLFNDAPCSVDELLKRTDIAMYQAKACGRNAMRFFDPGMQAVVSARVELEIDMRHGLQHREFLLHYQPQVTSDAAITGAEVLVRWQHPRRGLVSPMEFIPLAEDTGLIMPIGEYVLEAACLQLARWATQPTMWHLTLAVNVSASQFRHPDFVATVLAILDRTQANPHQLKLELTESLLVANVEEIIAKMSILKARGLGFSLDDFGTGYSSLSYLKRLPLDQLKIDQSFIRDVLTDPNDAVIARTIVALGQSLGLAVIAEGVETESQREFLANNNCHAYQGYLFSKPLALEAFEAFIKQAVHFESGVPRLSD